LKPGKNKSARQNRALRSQLLNNLFGLHQGSVLAGGSYTLASTRANRAQKNRLNQMGRHSNKRIAKRNGNGGNSLPILSQSRRFGRAAHHPLVVECVHGAKLQLPFFGAITSP
jgi:hypothetical protein